MSEAELRARVVALEKSVDWLQRELAELRAQRGAQPLTWTVKKAQPVVEAQPVPTPPPSAPPPAAVAKPQLDFETLIGRYGMLGIATLLALAAVGTFVSWA